MNTIDELRIRAGLPSESDLLRAAEVHRALRERAQWDGPLPGPRHWRDRLRRLLAGLGLGTPVALPH